MATLHASEAPLYDEPFALPLGAAGRRVFAPPADVGLHCHVQATVAMPPERDCSVTLTVRDADAARPRSAADGSSLSVTVSQAAGGERSVGFGAGAAPVTISNATAEVALELFVDGVIVELFVNGGERVLTTNSGNPPSVAGTKLSWSAGGAAATVSSFRLWGMSKSIFGPSQ